MNNDGGDAEGGHLPDGVAPTPEAFLAQRCTGLENTQVDSIFYCTGGNFNQHSFDTRVADLITEAHGLWGKPNLARHWIRLGRDNLQMVIDFAHEHDREVFWSLRMNDMHDNWYPPMMPRFKREHPELLMFRPGDIGRTRTSSDWPEPHMLATALDYSHAAVRDQQLAIIEEVCRRYDVDGIELDYMRNPCLFRPTLEGQPCAAQHLDILSAFARRVRDMTEEAGRERGRPLLIACRVPSRIDCCRKIGIDIERWLADDLIDVVVSCLEVDSFTGPIGELVELGHRYDAPVYACLSEDQFSIQGVRGRLPCWAAAATRVWQAGADGLYTFNHTDPASPVWRTIGDPALMDKMDKAFAVDVLDDRARTKVHVCPHERRLPAVLAEGESVSVELPVSDDVAAADLRQLTLYLFVDRMAFSDKIDFGLNGQDLDMEVVYATDGISPVAVGRFCLKVELAPANVRQGVNEFAALLTGRCESVPGMPVIIGLHLVVSYER